MTINKQSIAQCDRQRQYEPRKHGVRDYVTCNNSPVMPRRRYDVVIAFAVTPTMP